MDEFVNRTSAYQLVSRVPVGVEGEEFGEGVDGIQANLKVQRLREDQHLRDRPR